MKNEQGEGIIYQSNNGHAQLVYFVIKDHHFSDGNKRNGAFLLLLFLIRKRPARSIQHQRQGPGGPGHINC